VETESEITIVHEPRDRAPRASPFTLHLEYKYHTASWAAAEEACPIMDLHLIVEPLITSEASLKCTPQEQTKAAEERVTGWDFDGSTTFE